MKSALTLACRLVEEALKRMEEKDQEVLESALAKKATSERETEAATGATPPHLDVRT